VASYSPVADGVTLNALSNLNLTSDYYLLISSQVRDHPEQYEWLARRPSDVMIVMDNSVIEDGKPAPMAEIVAAADLLRTPWVVLPDVLDNYQQTIWLTDAALQVLEPNFKTVGVLQGNSINEVLNCVVDMNKMSVDMIALPRCLTDNLNIKSRANLIPAITRLTKLPLLLLGFSDKPYDDVIACQHPVVRGIDSAQPIWMGRSGLKVPHVCPPTPLTTERRPVDFWEQVGVVTPLVVKNVQRIKQWISV